MENGQKKNHFDLELKLHRDWGKFNTEVKP